MACPEPPSVANGYILSQNSTSVTYACNDQFGLSGYAEVPCSGGTWGTLPHCYTSWNRNKNNFIATGNLTSIYENIVQDYTDYIIYGVYGVVGLFVLSLLAGLLLCWLHQCGCYDGPAVGFGGSYVYTDRRCCYWGDLNVKCCNFQCSCCKRRCCRYVRKKSHGKIHFQLTPTPEQVALQKLLMKKKKKRFIGPIPCCLRAGRCLLGCLLCCCRWRRRKAKLAKQLALADEEKMLNIAEAQQAQETKAEPVGPPLKPGPPKPKKKETISKPEEKKEEHSEPVITKPEPPKPKKKEVVPKPEEKKEKEPKPEPVGPPLMAIRAPPPKPKKKKKKQAKPEEKKGYESAPSQEFMNVVESTDNPFGNNDVKPSKRTGSFMAEANNNKVTPSSNAGQFDNGFPMGKSSKGSSPSTNANTTQLTFEKSLKRKVAKWSDMDDDEIWKTKPQQELFSPEAPIKTRKTAAAMIPLASLFQISEKPKLKKNQNKNKSEMKKKENEGDNFALPNAGLKSTRVSR